MSTAYWITNVRLESGYRKENDKVVATDTEVAHLLIEDGRIAQIVSGAAPQTELPTKDACGLLALPSFRDMHIHIDKTYYGGPWKAVTPVKNILGRLEEESQLMPKLLPTAQERAEKMLELLLSAGSTHIRSHCNIDPYIGLKNLEATMAALETFSGRLQCEVVAFPQQGLLRSNQVENIRQALKMGATYVGGVDPATVDQNIEKSLATIFELAVEANAPIDVHLHDPDHLGVFTFKRLAKMTEEAGWQGRVTISHANSLADISLEEAGEVAEMLAGLGISITSTVPVNRGTIPIPLLHQKGVSVSLGDDSITDHWSPFGQGDSLEKAGRLAERFRMQDERSLSQALGFITGGKTPLDKEGNRQWPNVGDEADIVFVHVSSAAEAVARRAKRQAVMFRGNVVSGAL
ncbi:MULTISPECIES: amidohydrolase family protein [Brevibacillus]|uniref:amidohydrolase family protein n=1 Tax=Brevibacillus TaxID=55080 RepID=UPI000D0F4297|nr:MULTISPECIES: amidohydrolase family protein [Brevibacillus]MED1948368.1 amidohydrolase family protein [Brevibacillus formosus]MED1997901.1 amidohydrolase family protein [Brevibacillus formosus]MED2080442.1 amidohydrolase family protein [Brevibacillus formosus]PSK21207.1 deaminase [Brevibacillus sp. NRRL NRS-603]